jgi:hypothetical protein
MESIDYMAVGWIKFPDYSSLVAKSKSCALSKNSKNIQTDLPRIWIKVQHLRNDGWSNLGSYFLFVQDGQKTKGLRSIVYMFVTLLKFDE